MKARSIFAAVIISLAATAHAGTYEDLVEDQRACGHEGSMAAEAFSHDTIHGGTLDQIFEAKREGKISEENLASLHSIYMKAKSKRLTTAHEAHMDAWARCMDKIKRK